MSFNQLQKLLSTYKANKIVVVGLGNHFCSDDRAGLMLFEKLKTFQQLQKAFFVEAGCNPENYLGIIIDRDPEMILFVDAAENKTNSDGISLYSADELEDKEFSTHAYSIGFIEKYIKMSIDADIHYLGINISNSRPGTQMSDKVVNHINTFLK